MRAAPKAARKLPRGSAHRRGNALNETRYIENAGFFSSLLIHCGLPVPTSLTSPSLLHHSCHTINLVALEHLLLPGMEIFDGEPV